MIHKQSIDTIAVQSAMKLMIGIKEKRSRGVCCFKCLTIKFIHTATIYAQEHLIVIVWHNATHGVVWHPEDGLGNTAVVHRQNTLTVCAQIEPLGCIVIITTDYNMRQIVSEISLGGVFIFDIQYFKTLACAKEQGAVGQSYDAIGIAIGGYNLAFPRTKEKNAFAHGYPIGVAVLTNIVELIVTIDCYGGIGNLLELVLDSIELVYTSADVIDLNLIALGLNKVGVTAHHIVVCASLRKIVIGHLGTIVSPHTTLCCEPNGVVGTLL